MSAHRSFLKRTTRLLRRLKVDVRGASAVEYGLIVSLIIIAMVVAITEVASTTTGMWNNVNAQVTSAH